MFRVVVSEEAVEELARANGVEVKEDPSRRPIP
jgi:hypothetical protein